MEHGEIDNLKKILAMEDFAHLLTSQAIERVVPKFYPITFRSGELILQQGMPAGALLLVASGRLQVFSQGEGGREILVSILEPVNYVGEMALLAGETRNASVRALDDIAGYILGKASFEQLLAEIPSLKEHFLAVAKKRKLEMLGKFEEARRN
jgi:CRP-like cAMP-binding protein